MRCFASLATPNAEIAAASLESRSPNWSEQMVLTTIFQRRVDESDACWSRLVCGLKLTMTSFGVQITICVPCSQALPGNAPSWRLRLLRSRREAEPPGHPVPRRSLGTSCSGERRIPLAARHSRSQALPGNALGRRLCLLRGRREAEPPGHPVPRRSLGTSCSGERRIPLATRYFSFPGSA